MATAAEPGFLMSMVEFFQVGVALAVLGDVLHESNIELVKDSAGSNGGKDSGGECAHNF